MNRLHPSLTHAAPTPYWQDLHAVGPAHDPLPGDAEADLVVVGGGLTGLWTAMVRLYDGSPCTRHLVSGPIIEIKDTAATCRSSFLVSQKVPGGELRLIAAGRYFDKLHVRNGRWTFTERKFFLDQEGDMSEHLVDL